MTGDVEVGGSQKERMDYGRLAVASGSALVYDVIPSRSVGIG